MTMILSIDFEFLSISLMEELYMSRRTKMTEDISKMMENPKQI